MRESVDNNNGGVALAFLRKLIGERFIWFYGWFVCGLGALFYCYEYCLRVTPSVMSSQLMNFFKLDGFGFGNLTAYYYYAYTPMQFCVGLLMDKYGPRRLLTLAAICCVVGTFLFSSTPYFAVAAFGRFLIGFGSAFAFVGTLKVASIWLSPRRFAFVASSITSLGMLGALIGEVGLSHLIGFLGWRHTMLVAGLFGLVVAFLIWFFMRDREFKGSQAYAEDHVAVMSFGELAKNFISALKTRQIWIAGIIGCFLYLPLSALAELWGVPYLETVYHLSTTQAAFVCSFIFIGWAVGSPVSGWLSDRYLSRRLPLMVGSAFSLLLILLVLLLPNLPLYALCLLLFLFGVFNSVESITFAVGKEAAPESIAGTAVSLINTVVMLGGVVFQPLIGQLLDWHATAKTASGMMIYSPADFRFALLVLPAGFVIAFLLSFALKAKV